MRSALLASVLLAVLANSAAAAPVAFRASGTFDQADGSLSPSLVGKAFAFDVAFDPATSGFASSYQGVDTAFYDLTAFRATIDGVTYRADTLPTLAVTRGGGLDSVGFTGTAYVAGLSGYLFDLTFTPRTPLGSVGVPGDLSALAADSTLTASVRDIEGFGEFATLGRATASGVRLGSVPTVPGPAPLVAFAVGGLGLVRRRRR